MSTTPPATLPNPRLAELQDALRTVNGITPTLDHRFDDAVSAMSGGAWTTSSGSASDQFFSALKSNQTSATAAGTGCHDNVQAAISRCPATVPNPAAKVPS